MDILKQCQIWHEDDEFKKIIDALEKIEDRTPEMDSELARAYNNLAVMEDDTDSEDAIKYLRRALELLLPHADKFSDDHLWNFRVGYSFYYLNQNSEALKYFEKALESRPDDEDTLQFIDACRQAIGRFCGSALLADDSWDRDKLLADLRNDWGIKISEINDENENSKDGEGGGSDEEDVEAKERTVIDDINGIRVIISRFPSPVPDGEAELNARNNFMWEDAVEQAQKHKSHIVVAVFDGEIIDRAVLYAKILISCSKQSNALGVFTNGVVYRPERYIEGKEAIKRGKFPILNLVWFGLISDRDGRHINAYTYGLDEFGKYEMEIIRSDRNLDDIMEFMINMASYVVEQDVTLRDGETIGASAEDIHKITLSEGVSLPRQRTLKVEF